MVKFTIKKEDTTICDKCLSYDVVSISFVCLPDVSVWSSGGRTFVFPELSAKDMERSSLFSGGQKVRLRAYLPVIFGTNAIVLIFRVISGSA